MFSLYAKWGSITSSADGTKLAATVDGGYIWTSNDSGANWTEDTSVGATKNWTAITSSSDAIYIVATINNGTIYRFERTTYITAPTRGQIRVGIGTDPPAAVLDVQGGPTVYHSTFLDGIPQKISEIATCSTTSALFTTRNSSTVAGLTIGTMQGSGTANLSQNANPNGRSSYIQTVYDDLTSSATQYTGDLLLNPQLYNKIKNFKVSSLANCAGIFVNTESSPSLFKIKLAILFFILV